MSSKFENVPVESDTRILFQKELKCGDYDALHQKWFWDGIKAESLIFYSEDISELGDGDIQREVRSSPLVNSDSKLTIKHSDTGYTFVNFNFQY